VDEECRLLLAPELAVGRDALAQLAQRAVEFFGQAWLVREDADGYDGLARGGQGRAEFDRKARLSAHW
jgi:hypothetical protein